MKTRISKLRIQKGFSEVIPFVIYGSSLICPLLAIFKEMMTILRLWSSAAEPYRRLSWT